MFAGQMQLNAFNCDYALGRMKTELMERMHRVNKSVRFDNGAAATRDKTLARNEGDHLGLIAQMFKQFMALYLGLHPEIAPLDGLTNRQAVDHMLRTYMEEHRKEGGPAPTEEEVEDLCALYHETPARVHNAWHNTKRSAPIPHVPSPHGLKRSAEAVATMAQLGLPVLTSRIRGVKKPPHKKRRGAAEEAQAPAEGEGEGEEGEEAAKWSSASSAEVDSYLGALCAPGEGTLGQRREQAKLVMAESNVAKYTGPWLKGTYEAFAYGLLSLDPARLAREARDRQHAASKAAKAANEAAKAARALHPPPPRPADR